MCLSFFLNFSKNLTMVFALSLMLPVYVGTEEMVLGRWFQRKEAVQGNNSFITLGSIRERVNDIINLFETG